MTIRPLRCGDAPTNVAAPRTAALIGSQCSGHLWEAIVDTIGYDIVFIETIAHAYSLIRTVKPDLIVVSVSSDDADGCRLLSLLSSDVTLSRIPVRLRTPTGPDGFADDAGAPPLSEALFTSFS